MEPLRLGAGVAMASAIETCNRRGKQIIAGMVATYPSAKDTASGLAEAT